MAVSACSSTTFIYNRLDTVIGWYVDDYVSLSSEQEALFDTRLNTLIEWHRREELPRYVVLLDQLDNALADGLTEREMASLYLDFQSAAEHLRSATTELVIDVGGQLSQEQRAEFLVSLRVEQEEWFTERDAMANDEYEALMAERFAENLTDFMGRLNDDQKALIAVHVKELRRMHVLWHDHRVRWLDALDEIIATNPDNWQTPALSVIEGWDAQQSPEYIDLFEHNRRVAQSLLRSVVNSRTDRQDRRLRRTIANYREDFASLSEAGKG